MHKNKISLDQSVWQRFRISKSHVMKGRGGDEGEGRRNLMQPTGFSSRKNLAGTLERSETLLEHRG